VYRFTRTDTKDPTMFNSETKVRKERSTMVPVHQDIPQNINTLSPPFLILPFMKTDKDHLFTLTFDSKFCCIVFKEYLIGQQIDFFGAGAGGKGGED